MATIAGPQPRSSCSLAGAADRAGPAPRGAQPHGDIGHAIVPFHWGTPICIYYFPDTVDGTFFATLGPQLPRWI